MQADSSELDISKTADKTRGGETSPKFAEVQSNSRTMSTVTKQKQLQSNNINTST